MPDAITRCDRGVTQSKSLIAPSIRASINQKTSTLTRRSDRRRIRRVRLQVSPISGVRVPVRRLEFESCR